MEIPVTTRLDLQGRGGWMANLAVDTVLPHPGYLGKVIPLCQVRIRTTAGPQVSTIWRPV